MHSLSRYKVHEDKGKSTFCFVFSNGANSLVSEKEDNPDDWKADDQFNKGDEYEEELKAKAELAKEESKKIKKPEDAKKFLDKNKAKIAEVSKKLTGKAKENFDKVVKFVEDNSSSGKVDEASKSKSHTILLGLLFGCVGVISFLLNLNTIGWIALSPIVGPLLMGTVKKLSGLDESGEQKKELKKLDESGSSPVDYKKMWSDFKTFYEKGEDNCDVSFRVNN